jgi:uncharacterized membrane protein
VRQRVVDTIGEQAFRGLYSLVAFVFFIPLVWVYFANKHSGPWLWTVSIGPVLQWFIYIGMGIAFTLLVASFVRPSPASILPGDTRPTGAFRITRHPLLMALAIFGLLHMIPNGSAADVAFFGGFLVFVLVGAWHQDQRKLATNTPGYREFVAATPFIPFTGGGIVTGVREMGPLVIVLGVVVTIVVRYFHSSWF